MTQTKILKPRKPRKPACDCLKSQCPELTTHWSECASLNASVK